MMNFYKFSSSDLDSGAQQLADFHLVYCLAPHHCQWETWHGEMMLLPSCLALCLLHHHIMSNFYDFCDLGVQRSESRGYHTLPSKVLERLTFTTDRKTKNNGTMWMATVLFAGIDPSRGLCITQVWNTLQLNLQRPPPTNWAVPICFCCDPGVDKG
jgi:hypothetical protein